MTQKGHEPVVQDYLLEPGAIYLAIQPASISTVLGSSVAVCIFDRKRRVGSMNHFLHPQTVEPRQSTARFGNVATMAMIRMLVADGSETRHLEAQIIGGAHNQEISQKNVGMENVRVARRVLARQKVRVLSEDVGGEKGRKVVFSTHTNEIAVFKVDRLRRSDWYPYESDR